MNDIPHDPLGASVKTIGPFHSRYYKLSVGGYQVPYAVVYPTKDEQGNPALDLVIDDRFSAVFTPEELEKFGWILAQAMAVSAGYTCHGSGKRKEPFNTRMIDISTTMSELPEDKEEQ